MKKEKHKKINCGVKCNVEDCKYNREGCECAKEIIEVSKGQDLTKKEKPLASPHFCKSFCSKNKCD